jgi:hypothetical protein
MAANSAYLLECILYEKCFKKTNSAEDYLSEFQRVFPLLFRAPFTITPEIEDLDHQRQALTRELEQTDKSTARYSDLEDALWYAYRYALNAFYDANKPRLDEIMSRYQQFLYRDRVKEITLLKIVHTPAGYWLATNDQSWLIAREPFELRYTCKAVGVYLYRWSKHTAKSFLPTRASKPKNIQPKSLKPQRHFLFQEYVRTGLGAVYQLLWVKCGAALLRGLHLL